MLIWDWCCIFQQCVNKGLPLNELNNPAMCSPLQSLQLAEGLAYYIANVDEGHWHQLQNPTVSVETNPNGWKKIVNIIKAKHFPTLGSKETDTFCRKLFQWFGLTSTRSPYTRKLILVLLKKLAEVVEIEGHFECEMLHEEDVTRFEGPLKMSPSMASFFGINAQIQENLESLIRISYSDLESVRSDSSVSSFHSENILLKKPIVLRKGAKTEEEYVKNFMFPTKKDFLNKLESGERSTRDDSPNDVEEWLNKHMPISPISYSDDENIIVIGLQPQVSNVDTENESVCAARVESIENTSAGTETAEGIETSAGTETAEGIETSAGTETAEGIDTRAGTETAEGIDTSAGTETADVIETNAGIANAEIIETSAGTATGNEGSETCHNRPPGPISAVGPPAVKFPHSPSVSSVRSHSLSNPLGTGSSCSKGSNCSRRSDSLSAEKRHKHHTGKHNKRARTVEEMKHLFTKCVDQVNKTDRKSIFKKTIKTAKDKLSNFCSAKDISAKLAKLVSENVKEVTKTEQKVEEMVSHISEESFSINTGRMVTQKFNEVKNLVTGGRNAYAKHVEKFLEKFNSGLRGEAPDED